MLRSRLDRPARHDARSIAIALIAAAAILVPILLLLTPRDFPLHMPPYIVALLGKYLCYAILAVALDLVWGYCGILSLGHGAFFALGGYAMGMYLMRQIGTRGVYGDPILPDFMVFLNMEGAADHLVRLRLLSLRHADGAAGAGHCSPSPSAGSPSARASPACISRSSRRR